MAYLATLTLDRGRTAGLLATGGVAAGLSVHAVVAAFGLGALIGSAPLIYDLLRWIGVGYILFLAWEAWQADNKSQRHFAGAASGPLFWRGFFTNVSIQNRLFSLSLWFPASFVMARAIPVCSFSSRS
jgi:threonine/homoserine/homoserine lactone efflux protein